MIALLAVGAGALVGAPLRFVVDQVVSARSAGVFPWGTYLINATGALLLGLLAGMASHHILRPLPLAFLGTGFCGAYTTFSTFTYETLRLIEEGSLRAAALNVFASLGAGLLAAAAGFSLASFRP